MTKGGMNKGFRHLAMDGVTKERSGWQRVDLREGRGSVGVGAARRVHRLGGQAAGAGRRMR